MSVSRNRPSKKRSAAPESYDPGTASSAPANLRYAVSALVFGAVTVAVFVVSTFTVVVHE